MLELRGRTRGAGAGGGGGGGGGGVLPKYFSSLVGR